MFGIRSKNIMSVLFSASAKLLLVAGSVDAQNWSSGARDWQGSWGFSSQSQQSLDLSRSRLIEEQRADAFGPSATFITNDNRSNYLEQSGTFSGPVDAENRVGDDIGRNTNVVGAMNTGENKVEIYGDDNRVDAYVSSDNAGCLDGSINEGSVSGEPAGVSAISSALAENGIDAPDALHQSVSMGNSQSGCQP